MLTREDVEEKLKSGELTPQDIAANGWMCSVTQRISKIKQPRGGYIKPKEFEQIMLDGGGIDDMHPEENVSPSLVGLAVDYLTQFMSGTPVEEAFKISQMGATNVRQLGLGPSTAGRTSTASSRATGSRSAFASTPRDRFS